MHLLKPLMGAGKLLAGSKLKTIRCQQSRATVEVLALRRHYDSLNRLTEMAYAAPYENLGTAYAYDTASRRSAARSGDGDYWNYGYDELGHVESATKRTAENRPINGMIFDYAYDTIGNRLWAKRDGSAQREQRYYAAAAGGEGANAVNQYGSRSVPRVLGVLGKAAEEAAVTANGVNAKRSGEYFQALLDYSAETSANDASLAEISIVGTYPGAGAGGGNAVAEAETKAYLPPNPENYVYDADGNLLSDSRWNYTWDAENRLIAMTPTASAVLLGLPNRKLAFDYDAQWRRFRKAVYDWNATTETWETVPAVTTVFLYDGWNLIGELACDGNGTPTGQRTYTWGLDLSETLQGAGGVGGLLAVNTGDGTYYPAYDGNGNAMAYIDSLTGEAVAQFEYSPFGEPLRATGSKAEELSYRFSTKYTDSETGLLYYGYRFYEPTTGRWINRDPIEERGGLNLYGFVNNDGVNTWDYLGMWHRFIDAMRPADASLYTPAYGIPEGNYSLNLPSLRFNFSFKKGFSVSGCAPTGIPGILACVNGSVDLKIGKCCKKDGSEGKMAEFTGQLTVGALGGFSGPGWSIAYDIAATEVDFKMAPCPSKDSKISVSGVANFYLRASSGAVEGYAGCTLTYPGGGWVCGSGIRVAKGIIGAYADVNGGIQFTGRINRND